MRILDIQIKESTKKDIGDKRKKLIKRDKKRLERKICRIGKKYDISESVYVFDESVLQEWEMENIQFLARKNELLTNLKRVMQYLLSEKKGERKRFLLVVESPEWNQKELALILEAAKNVCEEIDMVISDEKIASSLTEFFYEECGLVIHQVTKDEEHHKKADEAILLLKNIDAVNRYSFKNGYVICEHEENINRKRNSDFEGYLNKESDSKRVFGGFVYEVQGKELPYSVAIAMAHQNPSFYKEIAISIVAIYSLECYNTYIKRKTI